MGGSNKACIAIGPCELAPAVLPSMSSPLKIFQAADRYCKASIALDPSCAAKITAAQAHHLVEALSRMETRHDEASDLLEALLQPSSFSKEQTQAIAKAAGAAGMTRLDAAGQDHRSTHTEQEHNFLHNYFPNSVWAILRSDETLKNKMKHCADFMVRVLGLRHPSAKTKRLAVVIMHVASHMDPEPQRAYDDMQDFSVAMKCKRDVIKSTALLKTYPEDPAIFCARFPRVYPDNDPPVVCPLCESAIRSRCCKEVTPCRNSNRFVRTGSFAQGRSRPELAPAALSGESSEALLSMVAYIMGSKSKAELQQGLAANQNKEAADDTVKRSCQCVNHP